MSNPGKDEIQGSGKLEGYFGTGGRMEATVPDYEDRPAQLAMARLVQEALQTEGTLIAEAPTGTGKTLAYLIPVLLHDRRIVISTRTKNLQEQIFFKDWPFLRDRLGFDAKVVLMKGRSNYLCRHRLHLFTRQGRINAPQEAEEWEKIQTWIQTTKTGDRAEIDWMPEDYPLWWEISSNRYICSGKQCKHYSNCFLQKMRREASAADLIVVNHHLFFADLALKEAGPGEVIPDYHGVIFDEAHDLEKVATAFFASRLSSYRIEEVDRDLVRLVSRICPAEEAFHSALRGLRVASDKFFEPFLRDSERKYRMRPGSLHPEILEDYQHFQARLKELAGLCESVERDAGSGEMKSMAGRIEEILADGDLVMDLSRDEYVHYVEIRGRGVHLVAEPIEPSERVRDALFANAGPVVFTSATLSTGGHFRYFKGRLGLDFKLSERILPTCFDYPKQSAFYIPSHMPLPQSEEFIPAFCREVRRILLATRGRTFLLFTSRRHMQKAYEEMAGDLPFQTMIQGEGSRQALLERFREDTHSVLFATASFWEGVDVVGQSLSCVIIDKLPFASPGEPLIEARIEAVNKGGGNAFFDYQLPQATLNLKQGLGRLIRHRSDRGLLALMDSRVRSKAYGRKILSHLPDFLIIRELDEALRYAEGLE